jgi:glutathione S-transferase
MKHQTEHYKKVNPLQMVPALEDLSNHINMG